MYLTVVQTLLHQTLDLTLQTDFPLLFRLSHLRELLARRGRGLQHLLAQNETHARRRAAAGRPLAHRGAHAADLADRGGASSCSRTHRRTQREPEVRPAEPEGVHRKCQGGAGAGQESDVEGQCHPQGVPRIVSPHVRNI